MTKLPPDIRRLRELMRELMRERGLSEEAAKEVAKAMLLRQQREDYWHAKGYTTSKPSRSSSNWDRRGSKTNRARTKPKDSK
jgi:hypothetical protein